MVKKKRKISDAFLGFYNNLVTRRATGKVIHYVTINYVTILKSVIQIQCVSLINIHLSNNICVTSIIPHIRGFQSSLQVLMYCISQCSCKRRKKYKHGNYKLFVKAAQEIKESLDVMV